MSRCLLKEGKKGTDQQPARNNSFPSSCGLTHRPHQLLGLKWVVSKATPTDHGGTVV